MLDIKPCANRQYLVKYRGQEIKSLCIGLSARSPAFTFNTDGLSNVFRLLTVWLRGDPNFAQFSFTSITINVGSQLHRDIGNAGPSTVRTLGNYSGGELRWFPSDDGSWDPQTVRMYDGEVIDTSSFQEFDGNCLHGVSDFTGERWSVIFFTTSQLQDVEDEQRDWLLESGALLQD